jgi:D-amino-acid dehydrogenase
MGCTGGNTGSFGFGYCVPQALPGILGKVPRMLRNPMHPLTIKPTHFPRALPWFLRFARASEQRRIDEISSALASILERAYEGYEPLVMAAGAEGLVKRKGRLWVYESEKSFRAAAMARGLCRRHGVKVDELGSRDVHDLIPRLKSKELWGAFMPGNAHTTDPLRFVESLARHFVERGGRLVRDRAVRIAARAGAFRVTGESGEYAGDGMVIAAGAWSRALVRQLGYDFPLEAERGYNMVIPEPGVDLPMPIVLADRFVAMTSMDDGLRLGSVAEYAPVDAPPRFELADRIFKTALEMFQSIDIRGSTRWMGPRPAIPDSLPIIGRASRHSSLYFAFGHGHAGLTLGGVTGRLIAELVAGKATHIDVVPFRPERFFGASGNSAAPQSLPD